MSAFDMASYLRKKWKFLERIACIVLSGKVEILPSFVKIDQIYSYSISVQDTEGFFNMCMVPNCESFGHADRDYR
jgi:hypothetical protein